MSHWSSRICCTTPSKARSALTNVSVSVISWPLLLPLRAVCCPPPTLPTSLADRPVLELAHDVQVADVPGVLLQQMKQDPLQLWRGVAVPSLAGSTELVQCVCLDDGSSPYAACGQRVDDVGRRLGRVDVPALVLAVAPWVRDDSALETPLEPSHLDERQVLGQLDRRPSGRQPARPERLLGQPRQLGD